MVGFLSFVPTNYVGLSELGVISFIGLIVGLITNLFFFSSLLIFFKHRFLKSSFKNVSLYSKCFAFLNKKKIFNFSNFDFYIYF